MSKLLLTIVLCCCLNSISAQFVVTTNGGSGLSPAYASLASAISALNSATITSPVVITCATGLETAPTGGYTITAQGTAGNTITIQGNGAASSIITAPSPAGAPGSMSDGIFKLVGADYITLKGFTMQENAANTTSASSTNNMLEWGVALLYATTTNGAQNNTIRDNVITLNRTNVNTSGIYSNSTHAATTPITGATATSPNSGIKIYGNTISNVNLGIAVVGPTASANYNVGVDIGGTDASTGNTITNFGTNGTYNVNVNYAPPAGSVFGIMVKNSSSINISYNNLVSSAGGTVAGTLRGIHIPASTVAPTVQTSNTISNNSISLTNGANTSMTGIAVDAASSTSTSILNINSNSFPVFTFTTSGFAATCIALAAINQTTSVNNNNFNFGNTSSTAITLINQNFSIPASGICDINNNYTTNSIIVNGSFTGVSKPGNSTATATENTNNNNFSNINCTSAVGLTINGTNANSSIIADRNVFTNWTLSAASSGISTTRIGAGNSSISSNTISGITQSAGAFTAINIGNTDNNATELAISKNMISGISAFSSITGITTSNTSLVTNIDSNQISSLASTVAGSAATVTGIQIAGASTTNVSRNKVCNLSTASTVPLVFGVHISAGTTINTFNNLIGNLTAPAGTNGGSVELIRGINITSVTPLSNINASFNTIYLNATGGAIFSTTGIYHTYNTVSTTAGLTLRNNIVVNLSSPGNGYTSAFRRSGTGDLNNYSTSSSNNSFYAGTPGVRNFVYFDGTVNEKTIMGMRERLYPREQGSVSENVNFSSTDCNNQNFLHFANGTATQLESAGKFISGINNDIDGQVRNNTPDIGADEFNGVYSDRTGPVISYQHVPDTISHAVRTLNAFIYDPAGVPTSGIGLPVLYWKTNANGTYSSNTATYISDSTYRFIFGGGNHNDTIFYFIAAQDNAGNVSVTPASGPVTFSNNPPAAGTPPTSPAFYVVIGTYSGDINVGTSETIKTITNANGLFERLNRGIITGNITVHIKSTITGELGVVGLNQLTESGAGGYYVTIKPDGLYTIQGQTIVASDPGLIRFFGTDRLTIDGSINGTSSRNLIITNLTNGSNKSVLWLSGSGPGGGCNNVTFKNLIITGTAGVESMGICASGTAIHPDSTGYDHDSLTITNNVIAKTHTGIFVGSALPAVCDALVISGNLIGSGAANGLTFSGIHLKSINNGTINKNTIFNIRNSDPGVPRALYIDSAVTNSKVTGNSIYDVFSTHSSAVGAIGIDVSTATANSNLEISNNMISNIKGNHNANSANSADGNYGLRINNTDTVGGVKVYFNTISIDSTTITTASSYIGRSAAMYVGATSKNIDVRNNILQNNISSTLGSAESYALFSKAPASAYSKIDYNNYFATGTQAKPGYITGAGDISTLAAFQAATMQDTYSINERPVFISTNDLHLISSENTAARGTPIPGILIDFDNDFRNPITPVIGADEYGYFVFTGDGSWFTSANWQNNIIGPTDVPAGNEVVIDPSGQCIQDGNLATQQGGKITIKPGKTLMLFGDLNNAGIVEGAGILNMSTGPSNIASTGILTSSLLLTSKNLVLDNDLKAGNIFLTGKSRIELGNYFLKMDTFQLAGDDSNFVVTNGTGRILKTVSNVPFKFHVGPDNNSYNPITITNTGIPGGVTVRVTTGVLTTPARTMGAITTGNVGRTWHIKDTTGGTGRFNLRVEWNQADEQPGFLRTSSYLAQSHSCPAPPNCTDTYYDVTARTSAGGVGPFFQTRDSVINPTSFIVKSSNDTSTFTGNGSWDDPNNWTIGIVPPKTIPAGREIIINHPAGGDCIMTGELRIQKGAKLTVLPGKKLTVTGGIVVD